MSKKHTSLRSNDNSDDSQEALLGNDEISFAKAEEIRDWAKRLPFMVALVALLIVAGSLTLKPLFVANSGGSRRFEELGK